MNISTTIKQDLGERRYDFINKSRGFALEILMFNLLSNTSTVVRERLHVLHLKKSTLPHNQRNENFDHV